MPLGFHKMQGLLVLFSILLQLATSEIPKLTTEFWMREMRTDWRKGFNVYNDDDDRVYSLETYCPNWNNAGPYGISAETGERFLESDWSTLSDTWTLTYGGKVRYVYSPWMGSAIYNGSTYFANFFLLNEQEELLGYVPWKFSMYGFDVRRPDGETVASADRDRDKPLWEIELFPEYTSEVTALDVAILVHLYEYTFSKDDVTLSIMDDSCTPFVLYVLPILGSITGAILLIVAACWWKKRKSQEGVEVYTHPEELPLVEKVADKTL